MEFPELAKVATRVTIWLSVAGWAVVIAGLLRGGTGGRLRLWWTLALAAYLAHIVAAFSGFYQWSHAVAFAETARQTGEVTGVEKGFGLWLNYFVAVFWVVDVVRWWRSGKIPPEGEARKLWLSWHVFLVLMIFNGTVVFGHGPVRWFGVAIFVLLAGVALHARLAKTETSPDS